MPLSPSKESLLARLNERAQREHSEATEAAIRAGKPVPPKPAMLAPEHLEFPRWVHRGWAASKKGDGHHEPKESRLVKNAEELAALGDGWTDEPPKPQAAQGAKK